jgi:hypothetical protein
MLEQYFNQFDKDILPRKYNYPSFSARFENSNTTFEKPQNEISSNTTKSKIINSIEKIQKTETDKLKSISRRNNSPKNKKTNYTLSQTMANFENKIENDSRIKLDISNEVYKLQSLYSKLLGENKEKQKELIKLKYQNEKNGTYLLNLEKILSKEKQQPKGILCKLQNASKKETMTNNPEDEKEKKIIIFENNIKVETTLNEILEEIERIKQFREDIISLSKQNNLNNMQIYESIKKIESLLEDLSIKINERNVDIPIGKNNDYIDAKNANIEELQNNYDILLNFLMESIKIKNKEFMILLNIKKGNTDKLMREIEKLRLENEEKDKIIQEKNKEINQIKVETEFIKLRDQTQFDNTIRIEQKKTNKLEDDMEKRKSNKITKEMRRSVKNSVQKIKRNFDMEEVDNQEFVSNIQSQIE